MSATDDKSNLYDSLAEFFGRKAEEADDETDAEDATDEQTESAGQKGDGDEPEADADQKQEPDDQDVEEDLIAAIAEHMGEDPEDVRAALDAVGQSADDMPDEDDDEDDEEDEDVGQDADTDDATETTEVSIDFGAKAEEHGLVDEDTLSQKMDSLRENIVEDLGQKLADENEEAIEEIAQKMQSSTTDSPAGGSFQDAKDFESELDNAANKEGWV